MNAAALGEHRWGAGRGLRSLWYVTVGTRIGGGAIVDGTLLHGLSHPEFGHLRVPHDREARPVRRRVARTTATASRASRPALRWRRVGRPAHRDRRPRPWELEARYLALGLLAAMPCSPRSGSSSAAASQRRDGLLPLVRSELTALMNGYLDFEAADDYVTPPALGARAGVLGALALAETVAESTRRQT